ncbi:MAG: hypothetical protein ACRDPE_13050, partial [Solirubrobacterales bacterium]
MSPQDACEVCGRTFLVGEKVHSYVSVEGRHEVCDLCVDRVAAVGWRPADEDGAEERMRAEAERKPGLLGRLFSRAEEDEADEEPAAPTPRALEIHELETERYDVEAEWRGEEDEVAPAPVVEKQARKRRRLGGFFAGAPSGAPADLPAPEVVPEPELSTPPPAPAPRADASPAPLPD